MKNNDIWSAVSYGNLSDLKKFYKKELLNSQLDRRLGGQCLLHITVNRRNYQISKFLVDEGVNINQSDRRGATVLHYIASVYAERLTEVDFKIMQLLLDNGADVDATDMHGNSCLWAACHASKGMDFKMVKLIMQYNPVINHKNKYGKSPLDLATARNYGELIKILKKS